MARVIGVLVVVAIVVALGLAQLLRRARGPRLKAGQRWRRTADGHVDYFTLREHYSAEFPGVPGSWGVDVTLEDRTRRAWVSDSEWHDPAIRMELLGEPRR